MGVTLPGGVAESGGVAASGGVDALAEVTTIFVRTCEGEKDRGLVTKGVSLAPSGEDCLAPRGDDCPEDLEGPDFRLDCSCGEDDTAVQCGEPSGDWTEAFWKRDGATATGFSRAGAELNRSTPPPC